MLNHRGWVTITFHSTPKPRNTKNHSPTSIFNIPLDLPSYPLYLWLLDHPYMGRKRLPGSDWQWDLFRKSSKTWGNLIGRHYGALGEGSTLVLMDPIFRGMPFGWKLWLLAVPSSIPSWECPRLQGVCLPPNFCSSPRLGGGLGPMIAWIIAGGHFLQFGRPLKGPSCLIRPLCGKV